MHQRASPQGTLALLGFLGQQVALERLGEGDLASTSYLERLFCSGMCFNLGHFALRLTVTANLS